MSPRKKRMKKMSNVNNLKRGIDSEDTACKRLKAIKINEDDLQAVKRKNFITACEHVSYNKYFDHRSRLLLIYIPPCIQTGICRNHDSKTCTNLRPMPEHAEESFKIEIKTNMWLEALEVCQLCITPTQYLPANVLKEIVEILLNSHEDDFEGYTVRSVIDKCQQILSHNFITHPPCLTKSLRLCYKDFLMSSMDPKDQTFTNRHEFDYRKGIVKYCFNRLEYEISADSNNGPLLDKYEKIPSEMQQSIRGLHWQKEKFEIFELLTRTERIERLMAVLESIVELLQFDLAFWHSMCMNNLGSSLLRTHKPLMALILWSNEVLFTGYVNYNCRQILSLFVNMVHLNYPSEYIRTMMIWLNTIVETIYLYEKNSNKDYPNIGMLCEKFANEFYKIISEKPKESILKIIEHIQPSFMQHLIGLIHVKKLLSTSEDCILEILTQFLNETQWEKFSESHCDIEFSNKLFKKPKNVQNKLKYLSMKCSKWLMNDPIYFEELSYPKLLLEPDVLNCEVDLNTVVHAMFITLESYIDAYSVVNVQETWELLNEKQNFDTEINIQNIKLTPYSVSNKLIEKQKSIYVKLIKLKEVFQKVSKSDKIPSIMKIFKKIDLLEL